MILWTLVAGAIIGWCLAEFDQFGLVAGAIVGAAMGAWLRAAVRSATDERIAQLEAVIAQYRGGAVDPPARSAAVVAPQRVDRPISEPVAPVPSVADARPPRVVRAEPVAMAVRPAEPSASGFALPEGAPYGRNTPFDDVLAKAKDWLLGGNSIVRLGLLILFVGLSFLARWAAGAGLFPIEVRLALIAVAGIALLGVGFVRREVRLAFALALQGGGVAVLYLTAYAAGPLFGVLPAMAVFGVMIAVCALGCALALLQNAQGMAAVAFAGGFAVPLLVGKASPDPTALFAYYTLLNLAVLTIAWRRSWRAINLIGFAATFGVGAAWGGMRYDPTYYGVCQAYLIVSVLIYVLAAILHADNTPSRFGKTVDSSLLFGSALAGFGLQVGLVGRWDYGAALSALGFAAFYILVAALLVRRDRTGFRLMTDAMLAIGVGFVTLAVPLAFDMRWTSSTWALEGAGAFWVGMRQARWLPRLFGLLLQPVAALLLIGTLADNVARWPFANAMFFGAMLVALPGFAIAWWLRAAPLPHSSSALARGYAEAEAALGRPAYLYAFLFWCLAWIAEICRAVPSLDASIGPVAVFGTGDRQLLAMVALLASAWLSAGVARRFAWSVARWPGYATLAVLVATLIGQVAIGERLLYTPGWIVWPLALVAHYRLLFINDRSGDAVAGSPLRIVSRSIHVGSVWLLAALFADCLYYWIDIGRLWNSSWSGVATLASLVVSLLVLILWAGRAARPAQRAALGWPLNVHAKGYYWQAALPFAGALFLGAFATTMIAEGRADPLPYLPLVNPVDLVVALAAAALLLWGRMIASADPRPRGSDWIAHPRAILALAGLGFVHLNMMWLRFAHHVIGVPWDIEALLGNYAVEAGLAIMWTLLALGLMLIARRRASRPAWLAGAVLLGAVVLKLFFVDLSNASGGERIITFIVVGVLMLVVGYFAPLPPAQSADGEREALA
jgi:uncharacterized membrane protein